MNRYAVRIGNDFEVQVVSISDLSSLPALVHEANRFRSALRRDNLATVVLTLMALVLIAAAAIGAFEADYGKLHSTWDALVVPLTAVVTFYFTKGD